MSDETQQRFSNRPLKLKEYIWLTRATNNDPEALALFLESRRLDPALDIREMEMLEVEAAMKEAAAAIEQSSVLQKIEFSFNAPQ